MTKAIDRATAFVNELSGAGTYKIVCKASNHDLAGPKKKHVDFLLQLTNNPRSQMSVIGDLISDRLKDKNWVVVFKTLILAHNLMTLGHERFLQCMATRSQTFSLENFKDPSSFLAADMSSYLRKYAKYLACLCTSYKTLAVDVGRVPKGDNSPFRTMDPVKVIKAAGVIQQQLDLLLEMELTVGELSNGVINTAFLMLYKDLVKLYTVYNDCMINLLEKFFEMKKQQCRETIEFYRRFLTRQEGVQNFLQLAEQVGIDKQTHLNLRQVPEDLLPALENHLGEVDAFKKANAGEASPAIRAASEKLAALKGASKQTPKATSKTGSPSSETFPSASAEVLEAQRKRFEQLKRQASVPKSIDSASVSSQDSSSAVKQNSTPQSSANDLLGLDSSFAPTSSQPSHLDPWGASTNNSIPPAGPTSTNPFQPVSTTTLSVGNGDVKTTESSPSSDPWATQPTQSSAYQEVDLFTEIRGSNSNFDAVFGAPQTSGPPASQPPSQFSMGGDILQPQAAGPLASKELLASPQPTPGLTQDVESSLAKAAANLTVEMGSGGSRIGVTKKTEHMWSPQKESVRTGGSNFQRQSIQARTLPPGQDPMKAGGGGGNPVDWNKGMYGGHFPQQQTQQFPQPAPAVGNPMMSYPMMTPQQSYPMNPPPMMQTQSNMWYPGQQPPQPQPPQPNDPFGAMPPQQASLF